MSAAVCTNGHRDAQRDQAGTVLILFALLLVGVFGLLGLVVDGAQLRITRQQLDAGAEAAALEGLRFKDQDGDPGRRARAITTTALLWDDDLDPGNGDQLGLGAGALPIVVGPQPIGGELQVSALTSSRRWQPAGQLQSNPGNAAHGDLVAGMHLPGGLPTEDDSFRRADFVPAAAGSSTDELTAAPAFLVRLRRSTNRLALDRQPGESSSGPALEWLWSRGSAWQEPGPGDDTQGRAGGLTVRATAIAATERALVVTDALPGGPTVAAFALRGDPAAAWHATAPGAALLLTIGAAGELTAAGTEQGIALAAPSRTVGDTLFPLLAAPAGLPAGELIVPVYANVTGQRRVIGFTRAFAVLAGAVLTVTRRPAAVLPAGASSIAPTALDARVALDLSPSLRALHAAFVEPVLAPVLRR